MLSSGRRAYSWKRAADSAIASLVERGLITEAGREAGQGGAVRYRTTPLFERVFGLESLAALPRSTISARTPQSCASVSSRSPKPERPSARSDLPGAAAQHGHSLPVEREPVDIELGAPDHEVDMDDALG